MAHLAPSMHARRKLEAVEIVEVHAVVWERIGLG